MQIVNGTRTPTVTSSAIRGFFGGYRFLSSYHNRAVALDGLLYPSAEHAYVAQKADSFKLRAYIATMESPAAAHKFGEGMHVPRDCVAWRLAAMRRVLRAKFSDPAVRTALLATGERYLEATNNWGDTFWGVCEGRGENHLGQLLMAVREELASP